MENSQTEVPEESAKKKIKHPRIIAAVLLVLILGEGVYMLSTVLAVKIWFVSTVYNKKENYLDCEHLPFYQEVEKQFKSHADVAAQVKNVPGVADFYPEQISCKLYDQGIIWLKGDMVLTYHSRSSRTQAQNIIGKDFFGISYRGEPIK